MLGVAVIGLVANLAAMYVLHGSHDLNIRSAFLHVLGDTLSSVAVIGAAIWIAFTGQTFVDPLLSIVIAVLILISSFSLLRDAFRILLQFAPRDVDTEEVIREMEEVPGVEGVHNVHLWSLCSNINVLDAHVYSCDTDARTSKQSKRRSNTGSRNSKSGTPRWNSSAVNALIAGSTVIFGTDVLFTCSQIFPAAYPFLEIYPAYGTCPFAFLNSSAYIHL